MLHANLATEIAFQGQLEHPHLLLDALNRPLGEAVGSGVRDGAAFHQRFWHPEIANAIEKIDNRWFPVAPEDKLLPQAPFFFVAEVLLHNPAAANAFPGYHVSRKRSNRPVLGHQQRLVDLIFASVAHEAVIATDFRTCPFDNLPHLVVPIVSRACHADRTPTSILAMRDVVLAHRLRRRTGYGPAHLHHPSLFTAVLEVHENAIVKLIGIFFFVRSITSLSGSLPSLVLCKPCRIVELQAKFSMSLPI